MVKSQENQEVFFPGRSNKRACREIYTSLVCFRLYRIGFPISGFLTILMICAFNRSFNVTSLIVLIVLSKDAPYATVTMISDHR